MPSRPSDRAAAAKWPLPPASSTSDPNAKSDVSTGASDGLDGAGLEAAAGGERDPQRSERLRPGRAVRLRARLQAVEQVGDLAVPRIGGDDVDRGRVAVGRVQAQPVGLLVDAADVAAADGRAGGERVLEDAAVA